MKKAYYENRKEKTIIESFGCYRLEIRYFENCNKAQVTMSNISLLRFPILWSCILFDDQVNSVLAIFKQIGFFDMPVETA